MTTKEVGFADKFKSAVTIAESAKAITIKTAQDFNSAEQTLKTIREYEKALDIEYKEHPVIIEAKRLQGVKSDLATILENARKGLKNGQMLQYENEQERVRIAEQNRLAEIARKEAAAETAKLVAEQKAIWDKEQKAIKAAERKGNDEAVKAAQDRAEAAKREADAIKAEAAAAPAVVVVVEKTAPSVARRMIPKFRVVDESKIPHQYFSRDDVKIGGVIRSLRQNHGIPGVQYYEEPA